MYNEDTLNLNVINEDVKIIDLAAEMSNYDEKK